MYDFILHFDWYNFLFGDGSCQFAIFGLIGSVVSGIFNHASTESTNTANARQNKYQRDFTAQQNQLDRDFNASQAQLSRDFNANEALKSRDWQEMMYNKYYSASAQRQQYEDAGLNPYLMMNGGTAATTVSSPGSASGSPASSSSSGAPSVIPMQAPQFQLSGLDTLDQVFYNKEMYDAGVREKNAAAEGQEIENETKNLFNLAQIKNLLSQSGLNDKKSKFQELNNDIVMRSLDALVERNSLENDALRHQNTLSTAQSAYYSSLAATNDITNKHLDEQIRTKIAYDNAGIAALYTQGKVSLAQARYMMAGTAKITLENAGIKTSQDDAHRIANQTISNMHTEREVMQASLPHSLQFDDDFAQDYNKFINTYISPLGSAFWGMSGYAYGKYQNHKNAPKKIKGFH